ncbi:hypothetical protein GCM10022222_06130 [Amycolatopsis ultiminotia]|uniref:Glycosyl transferase family 1 domain-containing protein n=1 Tax=Amycolatopsis ultiminotia TaxID=543629 RepID=A0ABP6UZM2_9PSEU
MTRRPTIAVAIHDGFYGCGTGAGYANYGFLETLVSLVPEEVRLVVLPLLLDQHSPEHHPDWHRRASAVLRRAEILPVDNGTGGRDRWGGLPHFERLVTSTAEQLHGLRASSEPLLVLAFDAPFLGLGNTLPSAVLRDLVLIPRSSALIHAPLDRPRVAWERTGLLAAVAGGARIGAISGFMADHLHEAYGIPRETMLSLPDGLTPADWSRLDSPVLAPVDSGTAEPEFVFAMGRAEPYKGFDDLLDAWQILLRTEHALPHLVVAATSESSAPTRYQETLLHKARALGPAVRLLTRFTPGVTDLLRQRRLVATVVPSHAEPFGRVPMEAFAAGAGPVITTTSQGLAGQVIEEKIGFTSRAGSPRSLAAAIRRALGLRRDQRFALRHRARQLALRNYDHTAAIRTFLSGTAPWLPLPNPDDRLRWLGTTAPSLSQGSPVPSVPPVKVPIGLQAPHWTTIHPERRVLVVAHHVTALLRLLDVLPVFDSDTRIQLVFSWNGSDPFSHGLHQYLDHLGVIVIPWSQAIDTDFDLVIAANHGGLTEITAPLVILPHGVGYTKQSPGNRKPETGNRKPETGNRKPETGNRKPETGNRTVFGLSPEWLLYDGRPIASSLVLAHDTELERLEALTPAAAGTAVVAGDPAYDRMVRSKHLREQYREALGVAPDQTLVTISTTWWQRSLMGSWPSLFREVLGCLDRDRYRVAALVHPNIWHGHGPWQVHTWLADCVRAGMLLPAPVEGWQATLLASDLVIGDHGATTAYGACLDVPVLLAAFPDGDVAPGSVGEVLGARAPRLNRQEPLRAQIERALERYRPGALDAVAALVTSCPGESAGRLRTLFYRHMRLAEPAGGPIVPVVPMDAVAALEPPGHRSDLVLCRRLADTGGYDVRRFPADVAVDRSDAAEFAGSILVVHEDHPDENLRRRAAVVLSRSAADGDGLAEVLRRHPQATLAAAEHRPGSLVATRSGHLLEVTIAEAAVAAAVVFERLLERGDLLPLPGEVTVTLGGAVLRVRLSSAGRAEPGT